MFAMKVMASETGGLEPREPRPPGTRRTSRGGAVAKVWVGRMDWLVVLGRSGDWVGTGSRVVERRLRVMGSVLERTLMQSRGPKASRAWKPGKRTTPMRRGSLDELGGFSVIRVVSIVA